MAWFSKNIPAHWSVDFVEHLRSVHFALVTTAVVLLLISMGKRDQELSKALTDATEIEQMSSSWAKLDESVFLWAVDKFNAHPNPQTGFLLKRSGAGSKEREGSIVSFLYQRDRGQHPPWAYPQELNDAPTDLHEFRNLWDQLSDGIAIEVPNAGEAPYACEAHVVFSQKSPEQHVRSLGKSPSCETSLPLKEAALEHEAEFNWYLTERMIGNYERFVPEFTLTMAAKGLQSPIYGDLTVTTSYPIQGLSVNQKALQSFFSNPHEGKYPKAFPELEASTSGMQMLKLNEVVSRLHDMQGRGEPNIEVVGLKLPGAEIRSWGIVLLLSVQFYFWLHLHELGRRIEPSSPGWDVAWIGMYTSLSATLTMLVSVCLLPLSAILFLLRGLPRFGHSESGRPWMFWIVSSLALGSSALLAFVTARRLQNIKVSRGLSEVADSDEDPV